MKLCDSHYLFLTYISVFSLLLTYSLGFVTRSNTSPNETTIIITTTTAISNIIIRTPTKGRCERATFRVVQWLHNWKPQILSASLYSTRSCCCLRSAIASELDYGFRLLKDEANGIIRRYATEMWPFISIRISRRCHEFKGELLQIRRWTKGFESEMTNPLLIERHTAMILVSRFTS